MSISISSKEMLQDEVEAQQPLQREKNKPSSTSTRFSELKELEARICVQPNFPIIYPSQHQNLPPT